VSDITLILRRMENGDPDAPAELLSLVYAELRTLAARKMAREQPGQTIQATALVHEAWYRLGGDQQPAWQSRAHFFGAIAEAMRRILIENARRKLRQKRGGQLQRLDVNEIEIASPLPDDQLLALDEALDRLAAEDSRAAEIGKHRGAVVGLRPGLAVQGNQSGSRPPRLAVMPESQAWRHYS
jgi:RNA polymerase sigma factor (TIGR02999 family)